MGGPRYDAIQAALLSTVAISLAPNLVLVLFPNFASTSSSSSDHRRRDAVLSTGQALAAGGLLGDVFLHSLPHAMMMHHDDGDTTKVGLSVLTGFFVFLCLDMLVRSFDSHHHTITMTTPNNHSHTIFTAEALLNLTADALHNFTDGLAIGASHAIGGGSTTTVSILLHELPHELGDYAILINAGFTKRQAIMAQFVTAIGALCGTVVGLTSKSTVGEAILIPFTAGGFIYLACVSILPDLLHSPHDEKNEEERHNGNTKKKGPAVGGKVRFFQLVAFLIGIAFMYGVALLEDHDHSRHGQISHSKKKASDDHHLGFDTSSHHHHHHDKEELDQLHGGGGGEAQNQNRRHSAYEDSPHHVMEREIRVYVQNLVDEREAKQQQRREF